MAFRTHPSEQNLYYDNLPAQMSLRLKDLNLYVFIFTYTHNCLTNKHLQVMPYTNIKKKKILHMGDTDSLYRCGEKHRYNYFLIISKKFNFYLRFLCAV